MNLLLSTWSIRVAGIALLTGSLYLLMTTPPLLRQRFSNATPVKGSISKAANTTLGFGAIFVLTDDTLSWRTQGLKLAAKKLGIELHVPLLPPVTEDHVWRHLGGDELVTSLASVKAALNYFVLLQHFLDSDLQTALLLEDDTDFSLHIKDQLETISRALWEGEKTEIDASRQRAEERSRRYAPNGHSVRSPRLNDPIPSRRVGYPMDWPLWRRIHKHHDHPTIHGLTRPSLGPSLFHIEQLLRADEGWQNL